MTGRADIERELREGEDALAQVVALLESGAGLASWPEALRTALTLALMDPAMPRAEGWKAVTLRRHLFGPTDPIPDHMEVSHEPSIGDRRRAERLRTDLPALVRYRAGRHLLVAPQSAPPGAA